MKIWILEGYSFYEGGGSDLTVFSDETKANNAFDASIENKRACRVIEPVEDNVIRQWHRIDFGCGVKLHLFEL